MQGAQECSRCGRARPIELEMKLKSGQTLRMISCTRCEPRSWTADGEHVGLDDVLRLTSGDPDFVKVPVVRERKSTLGASRGASPA
jgi:DNA-directed RNA polymerase subunit RPC12/RpoP